MRGRTVARTTTAARATVAALLLALGAAAPLRAQPAPLRGLDGYVERAMDTWGVAGLALAVVQGDSVIYARGYGVRDVRTGEPVDDHTVFAIGSNTKAFTAAALGILEERGRLDLDDPVSRHLPWFAVSDPWVTRQLTLRDLVTHRSGLLRGDGVWYGVPVARAEVVRRMRHQPMTTSLRSTFGYNNLMFIAAGEVVGDAAGSTWDDFVRSEILRPLGMDRSRLLLDELDAMDNVAQPHTHDGDDVVAIPWRNIDNAGPAGSITSSVRDMTRWLRLWLHEGEWNGRRILPEAYVKEALTPHTIAGNGEDPRFPMVNFDTYGLGFWLRDYRGEKLVMHGGGIDGMLSQLAFVPERDVAVVVLTNTDGHALMDAVTYRVVDHLLGAPERDWSAVLREGYLESVARADSVRTDFRQRRASGTRPSHDLGAYAGRYENPMYGEVQVTREDGSLVMRRGPSFVGDLEHWHYDTFQIAWRGMPVDPFASYVTFDLDAMGKVDGLHLDGMPAGPGEAVAFERLEDDTAAAAGSGR